MASHTRRLLALLSCAFLMVMLVSVSAAFAAGPTYPPDFYDPADDNPAGAYDLSTVLRATGAGVPPWVTARHFSNASASAAVYDPDWFRFDVSPMEVTWEYAYLFEAISFRDMRVDPVIEIYGPHASPAGVLYNASPHTFAPMSLDPNAIAGNIHGPWFNWAPGGQSTNLGASVEFRPNAAGTYWIRVRPYGDNSGQFYRDGAGPYVLRAKVGMSTGVAGPDRIATAVAISRERHADGQLDGVKAQANLSSAIVVNGYVFPDALSASALAGVCQGPILLTRRDALPAATAAELVRLDPDRVFIIGGPVAVSETVRSQIAALFPSPGNPVTIERVWGSDRIATSIQVGHKALTMSALTPTPAPQFAFVCNAYNFPDALSCSPMAAGNFVPVLLTGGTTLDPRVDAMITARGITDVVIVGGPAVISPAIETALKTKLGSTRVIRRAGADRYETSKEFAVWAAGLHDPGPPFVGTPGNSNALRRADRRRVGLATGQDFPDALAAGPFCGDDWWGDPKPLLLTRGDKLSKWVVDAYGGQLAPGEMGYFEEVWSLGGLTRVNRTYLFGGPSVLSFPVWWAIDSQS